MTSQYTSAGIIMDRYADVLAREFVLAKAEWGDSVYLEKDELLGHLCHVIASIIGEEVNQIVQDVYDEKSVSNSSGTHLDNLMELIGLTRQSSAYTTVTLTLTATEATTVTAGSRYATVSEVIFATDSEVVFTAAGTATVSATCTEVGAFSVGAAEVTEIKTTTFGISAVTNVAAAVPGRSRELDPSLKARHTVAVSTSGDNDAASVYEAVTAVTGVSAAYVYANDTDATVDGVPPATLYVSVIGGDSDEIAAAIDSTKVSSVPTSGYTTVSVYNETTSQAKDINFDIAYERDIYVTADLTVKNGIFPDDGEALLKTAIADHFSPFKIHDDVVFTAVYRPLYSLPGVVVDDLYIGIHSSPNGQVDIDISKRYKAVIAESDITLNITVED